VRLVQLTSQARLAVSDPAEREEAILEVSKQLRAVSQVLWRFSLSVQQSLDAFDDVIAVGQEEVEKFDVGLKREGGLARTLSWPLFRRKEGMLR